MTPIAKSAMLVHGVVHRGVTEQTKAAERMRRMRARRRAATAAEPILFERSDWRLFTDPRTLSQKAGCEPNQIGRVILKELVDNGLDAGGTGVTLTGDSSTCVVSDNGPGIDPTKLPRLFAVDRPLVSSKLKRLPTRGMLGNGLRVVMGAVAAYRGTISVTSREHCYDLGHDSVTGGTQVLAAKPAPKAPGLTVELRFPQPLFREDDFAFARRAVRLAGHGTVYDGYSLPGWYSPRGLCELLLAAAPSVPPSEIIAQVFGITGTVPERTLAWAEEFIGRHAAMTADIGELGAPAWRGYYRRRTGAALIDGATIPFCIEAWVNATAMDKSEDTYTKFHPLINRTPALAELSAYADSTGLRVHGCGLDIKLTGPKRANYHINLSLIAPFLCLTGDGKAPYLGDFAAAMCEAVKRAAGEAYRNLVRPRRR